MKNYLLQVWHDAAANNNRSFTSLIQNPRPNLKVLDLGCYHPDLVMGKFSHLNSPRIFAVDTNPKVITACKAAGIAAKVANVEKSLPFPKNYFDIITANQIIEHLLDTDRFLAEVHRTLRPGGQFVLATENLSSWQNIFALVLGWQAFSQHISRLKNIGNPWRLPVVNKFDPSGMHIKIFTPLGLSELISLHQFRLVTSFANGYAPFTNPLAQFMSKLDPTHSTFIGLSATKP